MVPELKNSHIILSFDTPSAVSAVAGRCTLCTTFAGQGGFTLINELGEIVVGWGGGGGVLSLVF
jgi:hypothetical protein